MTGRVKTTSRSLRSFCGSAIAAERIATEPESVNSFALDVEVGLGRPCGVQCLPYAFARAVTLSQVAASSLPEAPPKETRSVAPSFLSFAIRDFTVASDIAFSSLHFGVQSLPSAITKARSYVVGESAESSSEAFVFVDVGAQGVTKGLPNVRGMHSEPAIGNRAT